MMDIKDKVLTELSNLRKELLDELDMLGNNIDHAVEDGNYAKARQLAVRRSVIHDIHIRIGALIGIPLPKAVEKDDKVRITNYSNVSPEGVVLVTDKRAKLKGGELKGTEFWVSWDKIGRALFQNYKDADEVRVIQ